MRSEIDQPRICSENYQHKEIDIPRYVDECISRPGYMSCHDNPSLTEWPCLICRLSKVGTRGSNLSEVAALEHRPAARQHPGGELPLSDL